MNGLFLRELLNFSIRLFFPSLFEFDFFLNKDNRLRRSYILMKNSKCHITRYSTLGSEEKREEQHLVRFISCLTLRCCSNGLQSSAAIPTTSAQRRLPTPTVPVTNSSTRAMLMLQPFQNGKTKSTRHGLISWNSLIQGPG